MKTAYVIRSGTMYDAFNISNELHSRKSATVAVKEAKKAGFKDAYAASTTVLKDTILK